MSVQVNWDHVNLTLLNEAIYSGFWYFDCDENSEIVNATGTVAKITHIALGSGGVNADGTVIVPLAENVALKKEVVRKPYTSSTKTSDTSYEYTIKLEEDELVGTFISEMALIDEDGDVVAFSNFLAKGKDETEVTFTIEDNY